MPSGPTPHDHPPFRSYTDAMRKGPDQRQHPGILKLLIALAIAIALPFILMIIIEWLD